MTASPTTADAVPPAASFAPVAAASGGSDAAAGRLALAVLHEVLLSLAHGAPREATLALLADKACILAGCASAAILLRDPGGEDNQNGSAASAAAGPGGSGDDTLLFAAVAGADAGDLLGTRVRASDTVAGATARTGEPYLAFSPVAVGGGGPAAARSAAVVPIFEDGRPVGALAAQGKIGGQPFGGDDLLALSLLALAGATTLGYHRLQEDGRRQSRELSTLYEAVRRVAGQLSAQEVLEAVVEQARTHVENSAIVVFLMNDERTHFYIAADRGLLGEQRDITLATDQGLGAALLRSARPQFLAFAPPAGIDEGESADVVAAAMGAGALETPFPGLPARSGIAAPIRSGDVTHGLVLAVSNQPSGTYRLADANLLSALAAQAAAALENAFLYEDAQRRAEEAAALYELSQTITSTLRLDAVLDLVADSVRNLLDVDKFALFLRDRVSGSNEGAAAPAGTADRMRLVVERGLPPGAGERLQPCVGQGIAGWVVEWETPAAVRDVAADHRNRAAPLQDEGVVSLCAMPLQVGAATIGALCALSSRRRLFTVAEVELLYTIANQAAIAIENARVYADVRQKAQELRRYFHRVGRALGSPGSPEEVPQLIAALTVEVMGADRCALYTLDAAEADDAAATTPTAAANLRLEAAFNFRPSVAFLEDSPAGHVARRARPLTVEDLAADARFVDWLAAQRSGRGGSGRLGSYLGVPLRADKRVVGVLEVYTRAPRQWRGDEVRLLLTFASQAAVAFRNARLAEKSGRAARDARLLGELLALATAPQPPSPKVLVETVARFLSDTGYVALLSSGGDGGAWQVRAGVRGGSDTAADLPAAVREQLIEQLNAGRSHEPGEPGDGTSNGLVVARSRRGDAALAWVPGGDDGATPPGRTPLRSAAADIADLLGRAVEVFTREPMPHDGTFR